MIQSCRRTFKQPATVSWTCERMLRSASIKKPRSHTVVDGVMASPQILSADLGSRCWRRVVIHQSSFVLLVFNWSHWVWVTFPLQSSHTYYTVTPG